METLERRRPSSFERTTRRVLYSFIALVLVLLIVVVLIGVGVLSPVSTTTVNNRLTQHVTQLETAQNALGSEQRSTSDEVRAQAVRITSAEAAIVADEQHDMTLATTVDTLTEGNTERDAVLSEHITGVASEFDALRADVTYWQKVLECLTNADTMM
jgi:hypothetical protein